VRFVLLLASLTLGVVWPMAVRAAAPNIVEIDDAASRLLDAQSTRRLIRLELADIDWSGTATSNAVLYFRIFATSDGNLTIELWDRGTLYGDRHVSSQGSEPLRARRLALASAELARAALRQYSIEQRRRRHREKPVPPPASPLQLPASIRLLPGAHAATVGFDDTVTLGPRLSTALVFHGGPRVDLGVGWEMGRARAAGETGGLRWSELFIAPAYSWRIAHSEIDVGLQVSAAAVSLLDYPVGSAQRQTRHTWSSQLALLARHHQALSPAFRLFWGIELGHTLRPIPIWSPTGNDRLAGFYGGLTLGAELTVLGRDPTSPR
jgi:hypothetical protein